MDDLTELLKFAEKVNKEADKLLNRVKDNTIKILRLRIEQLERMRINGK